MLHLGDHSNPSLDRSRGKSSSSSARIVSQGFRESQGAFVRVTCSESNRSLKDRKGESGHSSQTEAWCRDQQICSTDQMTARKVMIIIHLTFQTSLAPEDGLSLTFITSNMNWCLPLASSVHGRIIL
ncbi:hypothetical protein RRG08_051415 [Elysia crispata]|uniref:Uncharacterized protein n=1 Tax=Elysia crispata TaxID=231223 RepID=A0AAE1EA59_9GAST|nr:hypothetical protein RRG08_051415 [Elysia crispata]